MASLRDPQSRLVDEHGVGPEDDEVKFPVGGCRQLCRLPENSLSETSNLSSKEIGQILTENATESPVVKIVTTETVRSIP